MERVTYSRIATKYLRRLPNETALRIMTKLNGSLRDVQPVKRTNRLRTRIGKYRVIFEKTELGISVTKIDKRGRVYKR